MSIRGGGDRWNIRPLRPSGHLEDGVIGCHRGFGEHLNVRNPREGRKYYWEVLKKSKILARARKNNARVITAEDPEYMGDADDPNLRALGLGNDGTLNNGDVVLMQIPEDSYRRHLEEKKARALSRYEAATTQFIDRGRALTERFGSDERQIHFVGRGHGLTSE